MTIVRSPPGAAGICGQEQTPEGVRAASPPASQDLPGPAAHRRAQRALRLRRPGQGPMLPGLGRTVPRPNPEGRRHRHPRPTSPATGEDRSAKQFAAPARSCGSCRPTPRTSTRSNRPSQRSNAGCATPGSARPADARSHLGTLVDSIQPDECRNYIRNAGYAAVRPKRSRAAPPDRPGRPNAVGATGTPGARPVAANTALIAARQST